MDGLRWSQVLLQWVQDSKLLNIQCDTIEQYNLNELYQQFRTRMESTLVIREENITDFLKVHFPHYELFLTESGQIAAPDHFYIFSLLLYFSCVRHPDTSFQQICNNFDKLRQAAVGAFLKSMLANSQQQKKIDRMMIQRAIQDAMPQTMLPPAITVSSDQPQSQSQQSVSQTSQSSQLSLPSRLTSADLLDSPQRLSNRIPRLSPPTPKTVILDERTRQLKELKAVLEAERYEKGYLEIQLKQLQDKNDRFVEDKRKLLKDIRELSAKLQSCNQENESPNKQRDADYKLNRIQRQLSEKEETLDRLKIELETISENNRHATEKINYRNSQITKLNHKILELEGSVGTLNECLLEKDEMIKYLRESNEDLQTFIKENRLQREGTAADNLNTSFECMELSSAGSNTSPENMASAVVDVQLKEKEAENGLLKRSLELYEQEKVRVSGLVGQFFRLYGDVVGRLPAGTGNPSDVGFVEKMNIFKVCYESLFEEYGKARADKEMMEEMNEVLEDKLSRLKTQVAAKGEVLRGLEIRSVEIEKDLKITRKNADEYQRQNVELKEELLKQKRDFLKLISDNDKLQEEREELCKQNLNLNVEFNGLKEEYESITKKIDYLMVSMNEDYEDSDYSSLFDKIDDLRNRVRSLKDDKDRLAAMNMKITVEKIALQKEISIGEASRQILQDKQAEAEQKIQLLTEEVEQARASMVERNEKICSIEQEKAELQQSIHILSEKVQSTQSSLDDILKQLEATEQSLESARSETNCIREELTATKDTNCNMQSELEKQQKTTQQLESLTNNINLEKRELENKLALLETDLLTKRQKLDRSQQDAERLNQEKAQLNDRIQSLLDEKTNLERTVAQQQDVSQKNFKEIENLAAKVHELEQLLSSKTGQIEQQERNWSDRHQRDQTQLADAQQQQQLLTGVNHSLLAGYRLIQTRIGQLEDQYSAKIATLQNKIGQLAGLLTKLSAYQYKLRIEKSSLEDNLAQIVAEFKALKLENDGLEADKKALNELLGEVRVEKQAVHDRNVQLEDEVTELNVQLEVERSKSAKLGDELETVTMEKSKLSDAGRELEADMRKQLHDAVNYSRRLEADVQKVEQMLAELECQLQEKVDQLDVISHKHSEQELRCSQLEVEMSETQSNLENQKQLSAQLSTERADLEDRLTALESENSRLESELSESLSTLEGQRETISRLCREKERLEEKVQELATALGTVRQGKSSLHEALEQEREKSDELGCQLLKANEKLSSLQREREELISAQEILRKEQAESAEKMEELTESIALLEEDRDTLREEKCRLEAEVERIDADKEALGEQSGKLLTELSKVRENFVAENAKQESKVTKLSAEVEALREKFKIGTEQLNVATRRVKELEGTCETLEQSLSDKGTLEVKISELSQSLAKLRSEKSNIESEKFAVLEQLKSHQTSIDQLKTDLQVATDSKQQLLQQADLVQASKQELEKTLNDLTESHKTALEQVASLETEKKVLKDLVSAREIDLAEKNDFIETNQKKLLEANDSLKIKLEEMASMSEQLLQTTQQLESLKQEKEDAVLKQTKLLEEVTCDNQKTLKKLEEADQSRTCLVSQIQELTEKLKTRSTEVLNKQEQLEARETEVQSLKESLIACEAKCVELTVTLEENESAQKVLEQRLQSTERELATKQASLIDQEQKSVELTESLSDAVASKEAIFKQWEDLQSIQLSLESQLQTLNQQLTDTRTELANQQTTISAKDAEINQLTHDLNQFQSLLTSKTAEYETAIADKNHLDLQLTQLQNELELVKDDKRKLTTELETLRGDKSDIDHRLNRQLHDYDTLNEAFINARELNQELNQKVQQQDQEMVASKAALSAKEKLLLDREKQLDSLRKQLDGLCGKNQQIDTLRQELMSLKVSYSELQAKRDELLDTIEHCQVQEKGLQNNTKELRDCLSSKQQQIEKLQSELASLKDTLHTLKLEKSTVESNQELQRTKILDLELKNSEQSNKIETLKKSLVKIETSHLKDNSKANMLLQEVQKYKIYEQKVKELERLHSEERKINAKCQTDLAIFKAKLDKTRDEKTKMEQQWEKEQLALKRELDNANKTADEKVKEVRNELEGKLEKMKLKMKTLYNDEMQKLRASHEKDCLELKNKMQYEIKKIHQQMSILKVENDKLTRQIEYAKSENRIEDARSDFKMEDEEGQVLNQTYLTDTQTEKKSSSPRFTGRDSIHPLELEQRNSMVLPHLKSNYSLLPGGGEFADDDNRDSASGILDDSSTSLISRRKADGQTTYKRPGPPTPSKKGGRLSFGGSLPTNDFQYKEILKDSSNGGTLGSRWSLGGRKSNVGAAGGSSMALAEMNTRRRTPKKFFQMISSSGLNNPLSKDEPNSKRLQIAISSNSTPVTKVRRLSDPGEQPRIAVRSKRESCSARKAKRVPPHRRKLTTRFDQNRRLSSGNSSSDRPDSGDPYEGFSYDGTPDRIRTININSMNVGAKADRQNAQVVVFGGDKKDSNNNSMLKEIGPITSAKHPTTTDIESSDVVLQLGTNRRDRHRRKSREQRRRSFNRLRNINGEAIVYRTMDTICPDETGVNSSCSKFESLAQQKCLERPSEILPRDHPVNRHLIDPFDDVVTSSTGLNTLTSMPLLERFSEIFRIAILQKERFGRQQPAVGKREEIEAKSGGRVAPGYEGTNTMLVFFAGLSFSALIFSIYLHYVDFRVPRGA
ncbi:centrosome-associated protein CEP250 isoform X2 [Topomyia yanbarensis]|uniref:centrosome-associated protein CEP250 isoform X2 n=1 Tax=Topomyia yanbarensis TaxID=2498891 RepID=UPI00273B8884|nr:centrosome-associated protein CEP250 isoform X2 [Topomyia yanbarensis]